MMSESAPYLAAAICTRNRPEGLRVALASLQDQGPALREIVVVENAPAPSPAVAQVVEEFREASRGEPSLRLELEPIEGLDFARNRALDAASAPVVAFLDDDVQVAPGWAEAFIAVFQDNPGVGLCTGRVLPLSVEAPGQQIFEANGGYDRGTESIVLPPGTEERLAGRRAPLMAWAVSVGNGSSLAVGRDAALELGGFDEGLDMGRFLPAGGDHDMLWRILQAGHQVQYVPGALAYHDHRREAREAYDQIVNQQRGLVAMLTKGALTTRGKNRLGAWTFLLWRLLKPGARLVSRTLGRDPLPYSVIFRMWWHCLRGPLSYPQGQQEARRRRLKAQASSPAEAGPIPSTSS